MYLRWVTYRCPSCNTRTESRIVTSPRVGVEFRKCRSCDSVYRTTDREWTHMTTGQRVGYFLNEWAVGIISVCILFAALIFYADKSDWRTPVWFVGVSIACCVPFWLRKLYLVRRSTARTSEIVFHSQGIVSGSINASGLPTEYVPPTTYQAPKKSGVIGRGWKVRLAILAVGGVFAILDAQWKTIDRYFPALNKALHSGTPTSEGDVDYLTGHMQQDEQRLSEGCPDEMKFPECRLRILAARPALEDLGQRVHTLRDAWEKERTERSVPTDCETKMNELLLALDRYLKIEDRTFEILQSMDSPETVKKFQPALGAVSGEEDVAVNVLHQVKMGNTCDGF
jgi:hypothetical protein